MIRAIVRFVFILGCCLPMVSIAQPLPPAMPDLPPVALPTSPLPTPSQGTGALPPQAASELPAPAPVGTGTTQDGNAPIATTDGAPELSSVKKFSYGDSSLSILFLPDQVERMKAAIRTFESSDQKPKTNIVPTTPTEVVKIEEPKAYPVFYLASIAYDSDRDWTVWVSGHKITAQKNETDLTIVRLSPDSVTFLWKPDFIKALLHRQDENSFAPLDKVKNRLSTMQTLKMDEKTGNVEFTLRQNQAFSAGYFGIFEGYIESPVIETIDPNKSNTIDLSSPSMGEDSVPQSPPMPSAPPAPIRSPSQLGKIN